MELQKAQILKPLQIIQWVQRQPQFMVQETHCLLEATGGNLYLVSSVQDLQLRFNVGAIGEEAFAITLHAPTFLRVLKGMDSTYSLQDLDTCIRLSDSIQSISLQQRAPMSVIHYEPTEELTEWQGMRVLKHLQEVASEQIDEADLAVTFTATHGYVGNYIYMKRVTHTAPYALTLSHVLTKLILACAALSQDAPHIGFAQGVGNPLHLKFPTVDIHTTLYSTYAHQTSELFQQIRAVQSAGVDKQGLSNVLQRALLLQGGDSLAMEFTAENQCICKVRDDFQESEFTLSYAGTPFACTVEVELKAMYRLFHKTLGSATLQLMIDHENELLYAQGEHEEMLITAFIS